MTRCKSCELEDCTGAPLKCCPYCTCRPLDELVADALVGASDSPAPPEAVAAEPRSSAVVVVTTRDKLKSLVDRHPQLAVNLSLVGLSVGCPSAALAGTPDAIVDGPRCTQKGCTQAPTHRYFWPGAEPLASCTACTLRAANIASALGFVLHTEVIR